MSSSSRKMLQAAAGNAGGDFYPYTIENSCRFNDNDSAHLYRTPSSAGNRKTWTISAWVKLGPGVLTETIPIWGAGQLTGSTKTDRFTIRNHDASNASNQANIDFISWNGSNQFQRRTVLKLRDFSSWYHIVGVVDTTQSTASDRVKVYVNGVQLTEFELSVNPSLNYNTATNDTVFQSVGSRRNNTSSVLEYYDGYLADVVLVDGTALTPSSFAEDKNGVWVPKNPSGLTFGTNGFYLDFSNSAALGTDVSGNGNNFTSSGLTSSDQMIDTPTNNFATLNALDKAGSGLTLSDGNLKYSSTTAAHTAIRATQSIPETGKWYWELCYVALTGQLKIGVAEYDVAIKDMSTVPYTVAGMWVMYNGTIYTYTGLNGTQYGYTGRSITSGSIAQCAYDADSGKIWFGWDGTWITNTGADNNSADPANGTSPTATISTDKTLIPIHGGYNSTEVINFGQDGTFAGNKTAQGNADDNGIGDFYYTPPTGFLALAPANLPEPTIGPNSAENVTDYFKPVLYTGNGTAIGSGGKAVTGVGFQPDKVAIKNRDAADSWMVFDDVRGATKYIQYDNPSGEATSTQTLSTFDSDGFSVGSNVAVNTSGEEYLAYCFKQHPKFFGIATYTGTAANQTVSHNMSVAPQWVIAKIYQAPSAGNWLVDPDSGGIQYQVLDLSQVSYTADFGGGNTVWNNTAPTASVFSLGANTNANESGKAGIAYLFASMEGVCKIGSYTGSGAADGPFVYTGFRPAFVILKHTTLAGGTWMMHDSARSPGNQSDEWFYADVAYAEQKQTGEGLDLLSNGFKLRTTNINWNQSGQPFIYMAFAECPFKYANAR